MCFQKLESSDMYQVKMGKTEWKGEKAALITFLHAICNKDWKTREVSGIGETPLRLGTGTITPLTFASVCKTLPVVFPYEM